MNRRLAKLEQRKKALFSHSKSIIDAADRDTRDVTPIEQSLLDNNSQELETVAAAIAEEMVGYTGKIEVGGFDGDFSGQPDGGNAAVNRLAGVSRHGKIGARYRDLFGANLSNDGWSGQQEYLAAIHSGMTHPRLAAIVEGTGSGGWLVPSAHAAEMLDSAMEDSVVMSRARLYPMLSDTRKIAGFDASTNTATTLYGGLQAQWIGESTAATATNPTVRKIELKAKKLALFTSSSNEIAEDGAGLEGQLDEAMRQGNGWFLDYAFLRGTGVGQPLGALNDPALITVDAEVGQDADTILYENLIQMLSRLHPGCMNRSIWVVNSTAIPQLLTLYTPTALTGSFVPVLRENDGGWQLLTRPVIFSEKMPTVGDAGDILLADFSQYAIGLRKEVTIEKSGHIRFMEDETVWRAITRVDGQGRWNQAFTPANGSTQSWAVTLAERA